MSNEELIKKMAWQFALNMSFHIEEFMDAMWLRRAKKRAREYQGVWLW